MNGEVAPGAREISRATLEKHIGRVATWSIAGPPPLPRYQSQRVLMPDYEQLQIGDVILTRNKPKRWWSVVATLIQRVQTNYRCPKDDCCWTHAALYVGELHVIEANKTTDFRRGIRIRPLTAFVRSCDLLVLRQKDPTFDDLKRQQMTRRALLENTIFRRRYDVRTALAALIKGRPPARRHETHVNCSEFVLQSFMEIGFYVKEYFGLVTSNQFFYPAHLLSLPGFDREEMKWFQLVHSFEESAAPAIADVPQVASTPGD